MKSTPKKGGKSMPEDNKGTTYSYNVCSECKIICCQDAKPPLSESRKKILKEYIEKQKIKVEKPFTKENYSYPSVDETLLCKFNSKETKRCLVHRVKPETCRAGPITFDINFKTKKVEYFLKKSEICAYAGDLYKNKADFQTHYEAAKKEIMRLIKELDADELLELTKIEEPQTFKVGEEDLPASVVKKLGL
jgi:Fe-S-cluster containining protein